MPFFGLRTRPTVSSFVITAAAISISSIAIAANLLTDDGKTPDAEPVMALVSRPAADQQPTLSGKPVRPENEADAPLVVMEASAEAGPPYETVLSGTRGNGQEILLIGQGEKARRIKFMIKMVNQSDQTITGYSTRITNPSLFPDESMTIDPDFLLGRFKESHPIKPKEVVTTTFDLPFKDRQDGRDLMSALSDFRLKIAAAAFESKEVKPWFETDKFGPVGDGLENLVLVRDCQSGRTFQIVKKAPVSSPSPSASGQPAVRMLVTRDSCRSQLGEPPPGNPFLVSPQDVKDREKPVFLYKEKAKYTEQARLNKVQGTVELDVLFRADGTISNIRVVSGLPDGLTEKAVEAALRVRFQPAIKNGVPISVRGPLRFDFNLY
ncbi:MAG TPA: energy transducer TonB [Blastocatellia bacterium]|nr:energy transducer TonB [Blastocatellia bacterium]